MSEIVNDCSTCRDTGECISDRCPIQGYVLYQPNYSVLDYQLSTVTAERDRAMEEHKKTLELGKEAESLLIEAVGYLIGIASCSDVFDFSDYVKKFNAWDNRFGPARDKSLPPAPLNTTKEKTNG